MAADACGFIAERAEGSRFLCPLSPPARVAASDTSFHVPDASEWIYTMSWRHPSGRGRMHAWRDPKRALRGLLRSLRESGIPHREIRLRGRSGVLTCIRNFCFISWRELGSTYAVVRQASRVRRARVRADLRATAQAMEAIEPVADPHPYRVDPVRRFESGDEACGFVADAVTRPPILCVGELPERLRPRVFEASDEGYYRTAFHFHIEWKPAESRGSVTLSRGRLGALKRRKRYLRRYDYEFRSVQVRGRPGIIQCAHERRIQDAPKTETKRRYCDLAWRELGSTYSVFRYSGGISWRRLRRDVREVARGLEVVSPGPEAESARSSRDRVPSDFGQLLSRWVDRPADP